MFHPTQQNWALAASWTNCAEFGDEPCKIYKELYMTKDLGQEWTYVTNYVFDFEWGTTKSALEKGVKIPDERIFVTRDAEAKGHQSESKKQTWSTQIDLFFSDDFFKTSHLLLESGNTIVKTSEYMFVAASHTDEQRVTIYSSNFESQFLKLRLVHLPKDAMLSNTFTLMDTSENQVFLFIENHGLQSPFGNLYISDEKGRSFTLSMENVIKGNAVDFQKVSSLDGTFVVNRYNREHTHTPSKRPGEILEFDEADMIAAESKKSRMSRSSNSNTENSKQVSTSLEVHKIEETVPASIV